MKISGKVSSDLSFGIHGRVIVLGEKETILSEVLLDANGEWTAEVSKPIKWVIAQLSDSYFAAAAMTSTDYEQIVVPGLVKLQLEFETSFRGVVFWLDPVELVGFPQDLLWTLRAHPDNVVNLHVKELPIVETQIQINVQRGKYRVSGGRFAIRPEVGKEKSPVTLVRATNKITGESVEAMNGEIVVNVYDDVEYRLFFASVG